MKKAKKIFVLLVASIFGFSGCEDFLEVPPDDRLELDTLEKAAKVVAQAYSQGSYIFTDMYTDLAGPTGNLRGNEVIPRDTGGNTIREEHTQLYSWDDVTDIEEDTPTYYWNNAYEAIAQANEVLVRIDGLQGDAELRAAIKGEALLTRAYHHFMLVNLFGAHYNTQAASNLGVPYITEPETEFLPTYHRNTVQEVYDLVEKDMLEGMGLVTDKFYDGSKKYHFTTKAAQAFASRFYLWKQDFDNCIKYSDLFLGGNPQVYVKDYDAIRGSGFDDTAERYGSVADDSNVLVMQQFSVYTRHNRGFKLSSDDYNTLFRNPFPVGMQVVDNRTLIGGWTQGTDATFMAKLREYFYREDLTSNSGQPYYIAVELKGEEVLLNRAEAQVYKNNLNAALEDINILAMSRYGTAFTDLSLLRSYYGQSTDETALIALLLEERKKEFWEHGLRWFDIKRYGIPLTHQFPLSQGGELVSLAANDLRKVIQIPGVALAQGLRPNPR